MLFRAGLHRYSGTATSLLLLGVLTKELKNGVKIISKGI
jgi:hypothetical protein